MCTVRTSPSVLATGTHVEDMRACCRYTRRRPDRAHGGVLNVHIGEFSACQASPHAPPHHRHTQTQPTQHPTPHVHTHNTNTTHHCTGTVPGVAGCASAIYQDLGSSSRMQVQFFCKSDVIERAKEAIGISEAEHGVNHHMLGGPPSCTRLLADAYTQRTRRRRRGRLCGGRHRRQ